MFFTQLETERLILKNIGPEDRGFFYKEFSDEQVNQYLFDADPCGSEGEAAEWIDFYTQPEPRTVQRWVLVRKSDGEKLGTCGFHCWDTEANYSEIGWDLLPCFWNQGYMTEALTAVLKFAREKMFLITLEAHIYDGNKASAQMAARMGFSDIHRDYEEDFHGKKYLHHTWQCDLCRHPVREENPDDYDGIDRVHNLAFGHDWESRMIRRIRSDAAFRSDMSLVTTEQGLVTGHIMFSYVTIESPVGSYPAAILAPLAVLKEQRSSGVGTSLVAEGIRRCRKKGYRIILVYGGPYYDRFGFTLAHEKGIFRPNPMPGELVRVLSLDPGALDGVKGVIKYPVAFRPLIEEWYQD